MSEVLPMAYTELKNVLMLTTAAAVLASCGPENNSRYGDEYWDPNTTKETFDPVEAPTLEVVYSDNTPGDEEDVDFTALISLDFTELSRRSSNGIFPEYQRGNATPTVIDALVTGGASNATDTQFWNDLENDEDKRLTTDIPGDYKIIMDFDVIWPNGNTVSYIFDDMTFTVPGCQTSFVYYSDYINKPLADNCVSCHSSGDARDAMNLSGNVTTRRGVFLNQVEDGPSDGDFTGNTLNYIFSSSHPGQSSANLIEGDDRTAFNTYLTLLIAKETADNSFDAATDFTFTEDDGPGFCFDRPSTFIVEDQT
jgi:hypothetical protein